MKPTVVTTDPYRLFESRPTFSHAASVLGPSRVVMTAGQVGADENGVVPADVTDQIRLAFANLKRCLEATGATVKDIVKLVYYIVDFDPNRRLHFQPLVDFLQGHRPATTLVTVPALAKPAFKFEVEAYIAIPQQPLQTVDVVVVGAGLSGLKAAYEVQKAGYTCAVVEARDRVGGKTWSVDDHGDGKFVDRGAAWINDTNQSEVFALAQALSLKLVVQNTTGNVVQQDINAEVSQFPYGSVPEKLSANGTADMVAIRDKAEETCLTLDIRDPVRTGARLDHMTLEQWIQSEGGGPTALASAAVWTKAMLGMEPRDLSALYFLNYCKSGGGLLQMRSDLKHGGQFLRFVRGTQSLSLGLADLLKDGSLLLSSPVRSVTQGADGLVHVVSARGDFVCKRVIVSVPTPLYKEIAFSPPLPAAKTQLAQQNKLGYINKVILRYASPWWRQYGLCGMVQSFTGPVAVSRDSSSDEAGQYSLTCFVAGDTGRALSTKTPAERFQIVTDHIKMLFGASIPKDATVPEPVGFVEHEWAKDQWAQGCPCPAAPPGLMTQYEHALRAAHGKVHFAGTETAYEWKGYMEGALRAGLRGAEEVTKALATPKL
ncbi:Amine oxidase [Niveomyces insectorum RCEF 264]|uniref:Amine oxidase n=1 Tax=Niveomyces insectorum RCEF 264 TaxID=1081102 RepID=A0A167N9P1_9HYPO|nr:Amine oxidase [Niveomyces insectorum RCEF 264]